MIVEHRRVILRTPDENAKIGIVRSSHDNRRPNVTYALVIKNCSPALPNVPRSCLSESNPPLLRNKEDQMASSISQGFALCNSRHNYEEPLYVLGWNNILVKLLSEYVSQPL